MPTRVRPNLKVAEAAGIEPTHPIKGDRCLANRYITALSYLHKLVHVVNYDITTCHLSGDCSASELHVVRIVLARRIELRSAG